MKKIAIDAAYLPHPGDTAITDAGKFEVINVQRHNDEYHFQFNGPTGPQWEPITSIKKLIPVGYPA